VPGWYTVVITLGDSSSGHDLMAVHLEGTQVDTIGTAAGQHTTGTYEVQVADGRLDLRLVDQGGGDAYAAINALEIR